MDKQAIEIHNCKSCENTYEGIYCPNCGQKKILKRLTIKESLAQLFGVMINLERGLWHTSIMMFKKPGMVVNDYLNGKTRPYIHPFRFLFLWLTIQLFLMFSSGVFDFIQVQMAAELHQETTDFQQRINEVMLKYLQLFFLFSIPSLSLGTKLFFKKKQFNFAEHLVLNSYVYGTTLVISTFFLPLYFVFRDEWLSIQYFGLVLNIAIHTYAYKMIFGEKIIPTILKSIMAVLFWFLGFCLSILGFFLFYFVYMIFFEPEILKTAGTKTAEILINPEIVSAVTQLF